MSKYQLIFGQRLPVQDEIEWPLYFVVQREEIDSFQYLCGGENLKLFLLGVVLSDLMFLSVLISE